jgi:sialate O-acetylesterase
VAGADLLFVSANAALIGETIELWSDAVPEPKAVRYGWCEACEGNLWNGAGLPLAPFRTDRD